MQSELAKYASGFKGCVRILANTAAASEFLPEALSAFLVAHPDTDIELEERPSYDIVRVVAEGGADVGVLASIADPGGLETFPFATDRLVAVMPRAHPLATRRRLAFRELLDHELVGLGGTSALQRHLAEHAAQIGLALKLRVRVSGFDAICRMVENGVGLAVIPETAALRCRKSMMIRIARLADPWALRRLSICVRRLDALPAHARQLVRHLEAWANREPPSADAPDGRLVEGVE